MAFIVPLSHYYVSSVRINDLCFSSTVSFYDMEMKSSPFPLFVTDRAHYVQFSW